MRSKYPNIRIIGAAPSYGKTTYRVQLVKGEWPSDRELMLYCDHPFNAPFGGRVVPSDKGYKSVVIYND